MMLDLSMGRNATTSIVMDDWKFLCDKVKVREDSRYVYQQGKPVVLLWGLGLKRSSVDAFEQGEELIKFFKNDPQYGGVYLIGGIDPAWRTLGGGSRPDPAWSKVYRMFDSISPWGRGPVPVRQCRKWHRGPRTNSWEGDLAVEAERLGDWLHAHCISGFFLGQPFARSRRARPRFNVIRESSIGGNSPSSS